MNSFVFDFFCRQKVIGTGLGSGTLEQLPIIPPTRYSADVLALVFDRMLELTYTAWDLQPFARDFGYDGPPFRWDEARRFMLRYELDAAYFHLYGIARDDVDYIMETFRSSSARTRQPTASTGPSMSSWRSTTRWRRP